MGLFSKKAAYKLSFYYNTYNPSKLGVTVLNVLEKTVENHIIELSNVTKLDEFFANEKNLETEIFNILNKIKDYDKDVSLVVVEEPLVYSYISPKMSKNKVEVFLNKELKENFEDLSKKYNLYSKDMILENESSYSLVVFVRKLLVSFFQKVLKAVNLNMLNLYTYETLFGEFINRSITDKNYMVLNVRKNFTSLIMVINNEVADFITFKTELDNPDFIKSMIYSLSYKHAFSYTKKQVNKVYVSTNLTLDETYKERFVDHELFEVNYVPFSLRDFDRFKFDYVSKFKHKSLMSVGFNFSLKKIDWKKLMTMEIGGKKKKGFTIIETVVSLAIISILSVTVFASILLANNLKAKEFNEAMVTTTIKNLNASFVSNPENTINTIYESYDSNKKVEQLALNTSKDYEFYFDADFNLLDEKTSSSYNFLTTYSLTNLENKTDVNSYSFMIKSYSLGNKTISKSALDFGEIYVKVI